MGDNEKPFLKQVWVMAVIIVFYVGVLVLIGFTIAVFTQDNIFNCLHECTGDKNGICFENTLNQIVFGTYLVTAMLFSGIIQPFLWYRYWNSK